MTPPINAVCDVDPGVLAAIGAPPRLFPAGLVEERVPTPYVVWQIVSGVPGNYLADRPQIDDFTLQIDAYGRTLAEARAAAKAMRDAIEPHAYVVAWNGEERDEATGLIVYSFTVDWLTQR